MKIGKVILVVFALSLLGTTFIPGARADQWNKKTIMTFSQPVEIPGQVLPAGTYTFKLANSPADRHIVQIFNADGTKIIATVLAINNYRLTPTGGTVVKFAERPGDNPEALKAWFYPGDNFGQEFVYPRQRAIELAMESKEPIPALASDTTDLSTAPIVAVTPEQKDEPLAEGFQTTPAATQEMTPAPAAQDTSTAPVAKETQLPKTGSPVPLIALLGLASLGVAFTLKRLAS